MFSNTTIDGIIKNFLDEDTVIHCKTENSFNELMKHLDNRKVVIASNCAHLDWQKHKEETCLNYMTSRGEYYIDSVYDFEVDAVFDFDKYLNKNKDGIKQYYVIYTTSIHSKEICPVYVGFDGHMLQGNLYDTLKFETEDEAILGMSRAKAIFKDKDFEIIPVDARIFGTKPWFIYGKDKTEFINATPK